MSLHPRPEPRPAGFIEPAQGGAGLAVLLLDDIIASEGGVPLTRADG